MEDIIIKLTKILKTTDEHFDKKMDKIEEKNTNKKLLNIYIEKYNNVNKNLEKINNNEYIEKIKKELIDVQNAINFYEKENKVLLLNNNNNISIMTNKNFNTLTLPNIKNMRTINHNINNIEQELNLEKQFYHKINEYQNLISNEVLISRKIKDNEINIKKYEEIIKDLNIKYNTLQNNYERGIFEENIENEINININDDLPIINNNNNTINTSRIIEQPHSKGKEKNKKKVKKELMQLSN